MCLLNSFTVFVFCFFFKLKYVASQLQRPGIEDVAVLKKELVQVQTLMDNMTLERERESEKLKDECKKLQTEYTNSEVMKFSVLK